MKPWGYIGSGIGAAAAGVAVLAFASSNDGVQDAIAAAGGEVDRGGDGIALLVALVLFAASTVLVLIGVIAEGVRVGNRESQAAPRATNYPPPQV